MKKKNLGILWSPQLVVIGMLLWAFHPGNFYGYFILLRWVCCGIFGYLATQAHSLKKPGWVWILTITSLIYNPIIPAHFTREFWLVINGTTIGIAVGSVFVLKKEEHTCNNSVVVHEQSNDPIRVKLPE